MTVCNQNRVHCGNLKKQMEDEEKMYLTIKNETKALYNASGCYYKSSANNQTNGRKAFQIVSLTKVLGLFSKTL